MEFWVRGDFEKVSFPMRESPEDGVKKSPLIFRAMTSCGFSELDKSRWDFELEGRFFERFSLRKEGVGFFRAALPEGFFWVNVFVLRESVRFLASHGSESVEG